MKLRRRSRRELLARNLVQIAVAHVASCAKCRRGGAPCRAAKRAEKRARRVLEAAAALPVALR